MVARKLPVFESACLRLWVRVPIRSESSVTSSGCDDQLPFWLCRHVKPPLGVNFGGLPCSVPSGMSNSQFFLFGGGRSVGLCCSSGDVTVHSAMAYASIMSLPASVQAESDQHHTYSLEPKFLSEKGHVLCSYGSADKAHPKPVLCAIGVVNLTNVMTKLPERNACVCS